jgi:hypothetical protein
MKDLKFVQACPSDVYYTWQVHLWLESLKNIGHSDKAISVIFTPAGRENRDKWKQIEDLYPESEFHYYTDEDNLNQLLGIYIPVLRPYVLWKHFKANPELSEKAIFYCDSDILFTKDFNVDKFLDDEVNYLSDTNSYINAKYFDSKLKDVLPAKLEDYKKIDVLGDLTKVIGISREIAEANNEHSGGAQYILKNIDADFWADVKKDCITIRSFLMSINKQYFESENKGFQSWCADMWAVLWNLWKRERTTRNAKELEFSWASDPIEKVHRLGIFHNAGITTDNMGGTPCFYKGKYHQGRDPFTDIEQLTLVHDDARSKKMGTWFYTDKLLKLKAKYNVNYS